jgi:hypothetical protein
MIFVVATCAFESVAQRTLRALIGVLAILLLAAAGPARAAPLATGLAPAAVQLDVIPNGDGTVTPDPVPTGGEETCVGSANEGLADVAKHCSYVYAPGQQVMLMATANSAGVSFAGWSDERCPQTNVCTLPMDDDRQSVAALFSPQRVVVKFDDPGGAGTVSTGSGAYCTRVPVTGIFDCGTAPVLSQVTLIAGGPDEATWDGARCDPHEPGPVTQPSCTVSVNRLTWASVGFGVDPPEDLPPAISVRFRIIKRGSGSGTVRSQHVDCGGSCTVDEDFGTQEKLVADAASGSSFTGWRGACSSAPTCSLAVGPVTAVASVFDAVATPKPSSGPSRPRPRFVAAVRRIVVSGHGRHRRILVRLRLNARATVRATLSRRHRRVASRRLRVAAGTPLLRLRVPARARRGSYVLALSLRSDDGQTSRVERRVRLPR